MRRGRGPMTRAGMLTDILSARDLALWDVKSWVRAAGHWLGAHAREEVEQRRLFLWLPVFFGAGVLLYFSAGREPVLAVALGAPLLTGFAAHVLFRRGQIALMRAALAACFLFAGFAAGALKTARVEAPVIQRMTIAKATFYVESIDIRTNGARLVVRPATIAGLAPADVPERVRVSMRWTPDFTAGTSIAATLRLLPPPLAAEPGGYDFSRDAWFLGIGAVGNLVSRPAKIAGLDVPLLARFNAWVDRGRNWLTARIAEVIGGTNGAVAAALVTGKRGTISEEANEDLRAAGIYHIVSISGLHMVLAAGLFLWALRALFALFPALALSRPIKVWSALFAMAGAVAYCIFSGAEVATQRSLIMTLVMLGAIVAGRPAISMRNLALAALIVLALDPNALIGPSFQMSFAAVAAMIAAFQRRSGQADSNDPWGMRPAKGDPGGDLRADPFGRIMLVLMAMGVTTLVASIATDPYALYHFHRITPYGLLGNMLVLPLIEFVVMPAAVVGVVASFFGLDGPIWWLMGQGVAFMMEVAKWVASLKGSVILLPAFGAGALLLMTFGLLWLTIWQTAIRWGGIAIAAAGIVLAMRTPLPDLIVSAQGQIAAFRNEKGKLDVLNARSNLFGVSQWLASDADRRKAEIPGLEGTGRCDPKGCTGRLRDGRVLVLALTPEAIAEDCIRADILITPLQARNMCKGPEKIIDRTWLREHGASRFFLAGDGTIRFESGRTPLYDRPWSRAVARPASQSAAAASPQSASDNAQDNAWTKPE